MANHIKSSFEIKAFTIILFLSTLNAYNIISIPIDWLVQAAIVGIYILLVLKGYKIPLNTEIKLLFVFLFYLILIIVINLLITDYPTLMPSRATTNYYIFIILRLAEITTFIFAIQLLEKLFKSGYYNQFVRSIIIISVITCVVALYYYYAQIFGLPYIIPNRMTTGGGYQESYIRGFTYNFHRATGTFQEPSHLAEWLIVPFFLSFTTSKKIINIPTVLISTVILLTGSLTGIAAILLGFTVVTITFFSKYNNKKYLLKIALIILSSILLFEILAYSNRSIDTSIIKVIFDRIKFTFEFGMEESSRGYIYKFAKDMPVPILGYGLGNSNIVLSNYMNNSLIVSFLNLYYNILYSGGFIGLGLLLLIQVYPIYRILKIRRARINNRMFLVLSSYLSWIFVFYAHAATFTLMYAIVYALLIYELKQASNNPSP